MTTIPSDKKAKVILNEDNGYEIGTVISFIEMDSEVNVNEEFEKYYLFQDDNGLIQTLEEDEFEWL